jgi:hypothetical protein
MEKNNWKKYASRSNVFYTVKKVGLKMATSGEQAIKVAAGNIHLFIVFALIPNFSARWL